MRAAMRQARGAGLRFAGVGTMLVLAGCGDAAPTASPAPTTVPVASPAVSAAIATATALWRDADPVKHPKGSCSGCHGADWFDLARIGSTDGDLQRRAILDGATPAQAQALVTAVHAYRARYALPAENARAFRPFQPGGAPLPGATPRERDVAFGEQLTRLLPTLLGAPIRDLAAARRAAAEVADLVRGTDEAGANPQRRTLRSLPTGVVYPLWSADIAHGEGTLNDWIGDMARDPRPEHAAEWHALVDAYVAEPTDERFWTLYGAVDRLLRPIDSTVSVRRFLDAKFKSALLGQHLLRAEAAGRDADFARAGLAFAYLDAPAWRARAGLARTQTLPADLWDVADFARTTFGGRGTTGFGDPNLATSLRLGGAPAFVAASVDPAREWRDEEQAIRLAWFWIGFTVEPSLQRSGPSNSTRSGEYMKQSLHRAGMALHRDFAEVARLVAIREFAAARHDPVRGTTRPVPPWLLDADLWFYGHWQLPSDRTHPAAPAVRDRQRALHATFLGNFLRMQALLHLDAVAQGASAVAAPRALDAYAHVRDFLVAEQPATRDADLALLRAVAATEGLTLPW